MNIEDLTAAFKRRHPHIQVEEISLADDQYEIRTHDPTAQREGEYMSTKPYYKDECTDAWAERVVWQISTKLDFLREDRKKKGTLPRQQH